MAPTGPRASTDSAIMLSAIRRFANTRRSTSGSRLPSSQSVHAVSTAVPATISPTTPALVQPHAGPWVRP
ncbi:Uncharacterised protein [Mycobacteroides abscessus subsp. abscessus]|nr:Uncharacterised protein [Mycobacteroides abscessus subsp. abscessus]